MIHKRLLGGYLLLAFVPATAHASTVSVDTAYVSTISGQANSNGINFSSYVYFTSGSSLTLQSAGGYIANVSSINASAFFGDGGHLTGIPTLANDETFSGGNTFTSSFTVQSGGRQIILSTSGTTNNIKISASGAVSFSPELHNSSSTAGIPQYSTSISSFGYCVPGSTLTITTTGGRVEVYFTGDLTNPGIFTDSCIEGVSFLVDGNFVRDLSAQKGFGFRYSSGGGNTNHTITIDYLTDSLPAATHGFCITIAARSLNDPTQSCGTTTLYNDQFKGNVFYVEEIK